MKEGFCSWFERTKSVLKGISKSLFNLIYTEEMKVKRAVYKIYGLRSVHVQRRYIPSHLREYAEKEVNKIITGNASFDKVPKFYTFSLSENKRYDEQKLSRYHGRCIISVKFDPNVGFSCRRSVILMPLPVFNDKVLKEAVVVHELTEALVLETMVNNLRDRAIGHNIACQVEDNFLKSKNKSYDELEDVFDKKTHKIENWRL